MSVLDIIWLGTYRIYYGVLLLLLIGIPFCERKCRFELFVAFTVWPWTFLKIASYTAALLVAHKKTIWRFAVDKNYSAIYQTKITYNGFLDWRVDDVRTTETGGATSDAGEVLRMDTDAH